VRRLLRGVLIFLLFATTIGAIVLKARHDFGLERAMTMLWARSSDAGTAVAARGATTESVSRVARGSEPVTTDRINLVVRSAAAKPDVGKSEPKESNPAKAACEADTLAYLDGRCSGMKLRWVRARVGEKAATAAAPVDPHAATSRGGKPPASASSSAGNVAVASSAPSAQASERSPGNKKSRASARSQTRHQHPGYWADYARSGRIREASWGWSRY
jgi:hypothetical protein